MLTTLDISAVKYFLNVCRKQIIKGKCKFIPRKDYDYKKELIKLGIISLNDVWKYILQLEENDCICVSFERDSSRDFNSEIYEFIKLINNTKVYIKLTLRKDLIVCISFHESRKKERIDNND